jgi:hypothetical protein
MATARQRHLLCSNNVQSTPVTGPPTTFNQISVSDRVADSTSTALQGKREPASGMHHCLAACLGTLFGVTARLIIGGFGCKRYRSRQQSRHLAGHPAASSCRSKPILTCIALRQRPSLHRCSGCCVSWSRPVHTRATLTRTQHPIAAWRLTAGRFAV